MQEDIQKILEYGVTAPSGDNSQPWKFKITKNVLSIYNLPDKDNPYLNYKQSGSLIAHGALLKNINIAASQFGFIAKETLFPGKKNLVANIQFTDTKKKNMPLFRYIKKRHTNRRKYENTELPQDILKEMGKTENRDVHIKLVTDRSKIDYAASGGSRAEVVILENKTLHKYLFKDVVWTEKGNQQKRSGLYIKTMEFNFIQKSLFYLAHFWVLMKVATMFGLPKFIAREDAKLYATGNVMGVIYTKKPNEKNFVNIGKEMQRIWLLATKNNISFQPISATLYFNFRAISGDDNLLTTAHKKLLDGSYKKIADSFSLNKDDLPLMMFRMGYSKGASAKTIRKKPVVEIN